MMTTKKLVALIHQSLTKMWQKLGTLCSVISNIIREIAEYVNISYGSYEAIFIDIFGLK